MTAVPRRVAVPFLLALGGLVVALGLVLADVGGAGLLAPYLVLVGVLLAVALVRTRRVASAPPAPAHCTCCDGDHSAPVRVV